MKILAVAGSGKTTTLRLMAERKKTPLLYVAFNRSVKEEAERKFPPNTEVRTLHSLALRDLLASRPEYRAKLPKGSGGLSWHAIATFLGIGPTEAVVVRATVERFLRSGEPYPGEEHIPEPWRRERRILSRSYDDEALAILEWAEEVWKAMRDPKNPFPLSHDGYVRIWRETEPKPSSWARAVLVDEAQDLDPNFLAVLEGWQGQIQRVFVGDPRQAIYGWRGAVNAMESIQAPTFPLTWSFRFGEDLARFVREVMERGFGGSFPIVGKAPWTTTVDTQLPEPPAAYLARGNESLLEAAVVLGEKGVPFHLVGGVGELVWLLEDMVDLLTGTPRRRPHPELAGIKRPSELWEVADHVPAVKRVLSKTYGLPGKVQEMAWLLETGQKGPDEAPVILSTVHKAKGLEWDRVALMADLGLPGLPKEEDPEEGMEALGQPIGANLGQPIGASLEADLAKLVEEENILYVALTRARKHLSVALSPDLQEILVGEKGGMDKADMAG